MGGEMIAGAHATRFELLMLKKRLKLAQRGHDLLVEKRDALLIHFFEFIRDIAPLRDKLNRSLQEAYSNFMKAQLLMGPGRLEEASDGVVDKFEVSEKTRSIIGVMIPLYELHAKPRPEKGWWYSIGQTNAALDDAVRAMEKSLEIIVELAEIESSVKRLAAAIVMTKRRVNALETIIIPRFQNTIHFIAMSLDERAREDFFRLKRIKKLHEEAEELEGAEAPLQPPLLTPTPSAQ